MSIDRNTALCLHVSEEHNAGFWVKSLLYYQIKLSDFLSQHGNSHNWARSTTPANHTVGNRFLPTPAFWCATAGGSRGCKFYKTTKIIKFHLPALLMHVLFSLHVLLHWNRHGVKDYRGEEKTNLWPALDELRLPFWWHISFCSTAGTGVIFVSGSISFSTWLRGHLGSGLLFSLLLFFKFCQLFTK